MKRHQQTAIWKKWSYVLTVALTNLNLSAAITDADLAKVTKLIQEGKTGRAKAEITILLDDSPDDPNASKLRKIQDSLTNPATTKSAPTISSGSGMTAEQRLEMNTFVMGIKQALESQSYEFKRKTLQDLLNRPSPFKTLYADQIPYWKMRATAALELDDYDNGWAVGQNLKKLGALESSDTEIISLMAKLNLKGWLVDTRGKAAAAKYGDLIGTWGIERTEGKLGYVDKDKLKLSGSITIKHSDEGLAISGTLSTDGEEYSGSGKRWLQQIGRIKLTAQTIDPEKGTVGGEFLYTDMYRYPKDPDFSRTRNESWTTKLVYFKVEDVWSESGSKKGLVLFRKDNDGERVGFILLKR